jgi:hypothetical protein
MLEESEKDFLNQWKWYEAWNQWTQKHFILWGSQTENFNPLKLSIRCCSVSVLSEEQSLLRRKTILFMHFRELTACTFAASSLTLKGSVNVIYSPMLATSFMPNDSFVYSSAVKIAGTYYSETMVDFQQTTISQKKSSKWRRFHNYVIYTCSIGI